MYIFQGFVNLWRIFPFWIRVVVTFIVGSFGYAYYYYKSHGTEASTSSFAVAGFSLMFAYLAIVKINELGKNGEDND